MLISLPNIAKTIESNTVGESNIKITRIVKFIRKGGMSLWVF